MSMQQVNNIFRVFKGVESEVNGLKSRVEHLEACSQRYTAYIRHLVKVNKQMAAGQQRLVARISALEKDLAEGAPITPKRTSILVAAVASYVPIYVHVTRMAPAAEAARVSPVTIAVAETAAQVAPPPPPPAAAVAAAAVAIAASELAGSQGVVVHCCKRPRKTAADDAVALVQPRSVKIKTEPEFCVKEEPATTG